MVPIIPALLFLSTATAAQSYFPPQAKGLRTFDSSHIQDASLSYKNTPICSTPDLNTYSGYVSLPPRADDASPHTSNLFFYYAKSTKNRTSPLTIYLGGGPGASSISSMMTETGPCSVNPDSNSTSPNPWAWTRESDILFIDQPVQTGFSYDVLTNITIDYTTSMIIPTDFQDGILAVNHTFGVGVLGSQDYNGTANSTTNGARTLWDFMQVWLNEFPEYESPERKVHIWTESFGGRYGPTYAAYFLDQNEKIGRGQVDRVSSPSQIHVETLSIHNGCSDVVVQGALYPEFAYNNTYGVQVINTEQYESAKHNLTKMGGCLDMALECQALAQKLDPYNFGDNAEVNTLCLAADTYCYANVLAVYALSGRDIHDMAEAPTTTVPAPYVDGFFNRAWVQEALGVPVNFTSNSNVVYNAFGSTGNALITRGNAMADFGSIMKRGVKVNLIYGDRDYLCNWMGGENISLSIKHDQSAAFSSSGYTNLITNHTYIGGLVRQHGNLSFTRVFDAGHAAPAFQPETMFRVFSRIMNSKDIATGNVSLSGERGAKYRTQGTHSSFHIKNKLPDPAPPVCYTLDMATTCTESQRSALMNGTAIVEDFLVKWPSS